LGTSAISGNSVAIHSLDQPEIIAEEISKMSVNADEEDSFNGNITPRFSSEEYIDTIKKIKAHIAIGDFYELNFCQEFYSENSIINPLKTFQRLNKISKAPFSCFYKFKQQFLISSSPERFIKKIERKVISQPIKGTIQRSNDDLLDLNLKNQLLNDQKEKSENVMIVDLVRNDLSRSCEAGSISVESLFEIKSFAQVHHMVSTISGILKEKFHPIDAIKNAFPMGSMTGAPKIRVMEAIEKYEQTKRGLYSGSVGYFTPGGDYDFNVIIRSILYNRDSKYLSCHVGSAITSASIPVKEYEECLLKAEGMMKALKPQQQVLA